MIGEVEQKVVLVGGGSGLYRHAATDSFGFELRTQMLGKVVLTQRVHSIIHPGVDGRIVTPEVLMGIDLHGRSFPGDHIRSAGSARREPRLDDYRKNRQTDATDADGGRAWNEKNFWCWLREFWL